MALSNIGNEPRREITEQVIGVALFAVYLAADYWIVSTIAPTRTIDWAFGLFFVGIGLPLAAAALAVIAITIHGLGDLACNGLARFGLDPRPKQRYRR